MLSHSLFRQCLNDEFVRGSLTAMFEKSFLDECAVVLSRRMDLF
jgi:hypothetical protein